LDRHVSSRAGEVEISIDRPFRENCYKFATGPVRVTFRGPGGVRTVAINDQCGHLTKTGGHRQRWQVRGLYRHGTLYAQLQGPVPPNGTKDLQLQSTLRRQDARQRPFIITTKHTPGYRIYEGTDAFINVCVNDLRKI
jgi:hypothetical protein